MAGSRNHHVSERNAVHTRTRLRRSRGCESRLRDTANAIGSRDLAHSTIDDWFNLAAFAEPAPYIIGNAGRNSVRGPGQNWDTSILKNFHFTERWYLQFRSEFFNAFNHANFSNPNANTDDPVHGGQITSTSTDARIIQFGLKLYF